MMRWLDDSSLNEASARSTKSYFDESGHQLENQGEDEEV